MLLTKQKVIIQIHPLHHQSRHRISTLRPRSIRHSRPECHWWVSSTYQRRLWTEWHTQRSVALSLSPMHNCNLCFNIIVLLFPFHPLFRFLFLRWFFFSAWFCFVICFSSLPMYVFSWWSLFEIHLNCIIIICMLLCPPLTRPVGYSFSRICLALPNSL